MALFAYEISQMMAARSLEMALASALTIVSQSRGGSGKALLSDLVLWSSVLLLVPPDTAIAASSDECGLNTNDK